MWIVGVGCGFIGLMVVIIWVKKSRMQRKADNNIRRMECRPRSAQQGGRVQQQQQQIRFKRPMTGGGIKRSLQQNEIEELKRFKIQKKLDQMSQNDNMTFMQRKEQEVLETENFINDDSGSTIRFRFKIVMMSL